MGEYEPDDSRIVTQNPSGTPIEPERTGPREGETRNDGANVAPQQQKPVEGVDHDDKDRWQVNEDAAKQPNA